MCSAANFPCAVARASHSSGCWLLALLSSGDPVKPRSGEGPVC